MLHACYIYNTIYIYESLQFLFIRALRQRAHTCRHHGPFCIVLRYLWYDRPASLLQALVQVLGVVHVHGLFVNPAPLVPEPVRVLLVVVVVALVDAHAAVPLHDLQRRAVDGRLHPDGVARISRLVREWYPHTALLQSHCVKVVIILSLDRLVDGLGLGQQQLDLVELRGQLRGGDLQVRRAGLHRGSNVVQPLVHLQDVGDGEAVEAAQQCCAYNAGTAMAVLGEEVHVVAAVVLDGVDGAGPS